MPTPGSSFVELRAVSQMAGAGSPLSEITLSIPAAGVTLLRGEPGSGTRDLLRLIGLLDAPEQGLIVVDGQPTDGWSEERRAEFRTTRFGFLLPAPFLLPALTVIENVAMPIFKRVTAITPADAGRRASELLAFVGLAGWEESPAGELDPLAQYRAAVARSLANEPALLLVEELDGALAGDALLQILSLLRHIATERGLAVAGTVSPRFTAPPGVRLLDLVEGRLQAEPPLAPAPLN